MVMNGLLKIQIVEQEITNDWKLLVDLRDEFRAHDTEK